MYILYAERDGFTPVHIGNYSTLDEAAEDIEFLDTHANILMGMPDVYPSEGCTFETWDFFAQGTDGTYWCYSDDWYEGE